MLKKELRLRKMKDFKILFTNGFTLKDDGLYIKVYFIDFLKYLNRFQKNDLKISVIISKKIHKSAVKRNKIKRRLREAIRINLNNYSLKKGILIAFIVNDLRYLTCSFTDVENQIKKILQKIEKLYVKKNKSSN